MPELPEVETVRRGLEPHLVGRAVQDVVVRQRRLRYPLPRDLPAKLTRRRLLAIARRGKYLLFHFAHGVLIAHLGMSGSLRMTDAATPPGKHDHLDFVFGAGKILRYRDARRFGLFLWCAGDAEQHRLLSGLGVEPLDAAFDGDYLYALSRGQRVAVKNFIMDSHVVVGVGNIYASEALFLAGIHPARPAGRVARARYAALAGAVRTVLRKAIKQGGTSLRDFVREDGTPGYFRVSLNVYGREGEPCPRCAAPIKRRVLGQRSSYYCDRCQR